MGTEQILSVYPIASSLLYRDRPLRQRAMAAEASVERDQFEAIGRAACLITSAVDKRLAWQYTATWQCVAIRVFANLA